MRRKQSSFSTQNTPILGAGAADAAGAVFGDTRERVPGEFHVTQITFSIVMANCQVRMKVLGSGLDFSTRKHT